MAKKTKAPKQVETLTHEEAKRRNIPTAEMQSFAERHEEAAPEEVRYPRETPLEPGSTRARNRDLDPQLVWKGKDEQDWSDLVAVAPPIYIQEKIHPKAIIDDLKRRAKKNQQQDDDTPDLFADFNGLDDPEARTEFYEHEQNWTNRMILGDSLQVMASLAEKEGLRGQVQCIYIDPPYGIRFNSNWQVSTRSRDVKDGKAEQISREPEQVKAFRDTWKDGIHSYLTYLRDRLTAARDLLKDSGSIFVQIGDENVHRVRALMDEVFGEGSFITEIVVKKKGSQISVALESVNDFILWYNKKPKKEGFLKTRPLFERRAERELFDDFPYVELGDGRRKSIKELELEDAVPYWGNLGLLKQNYRNFRLFGLNPLKSGGFRKNQSIDFIYQARRFPINDRQCWKHTVQSHDGLRPGMERLALSNRLFPLKHDVRFVRYATIPSYKRMSNWWDGLGGASSPLYIVQTNAELVKRCILMTTDPGDLVLDPTCGSGTTATVAEQWGRRWITVDTSRVALALARARIMGARYPYYLLADSPEGQQKEAELSGTPPAQHATHGDVRHGFVYRRFSLVTSGVIANNAEIDVIWDKWQATLEPLREKVNAALGEAWAEWEIPREAGNDWPRDARDAHAAWWEARIARQREIDDSIARNADQEVLYDQPYEDSSRVRVAGPFTMESLSPHRVVPADEDTLWEEVSAAEGERVPAARSGRKPDSWQEHTDFAQIVLDHLKLAGVQQSSKEERIAFTSLTPWPGDYVAADGRFMEGETERKAAIFIGPEFGTVARPDLVAAAREAMDAGFDLLVACAFNYDAHATDFDKLGPIRVVRARMNPDLHMADELKNTGGGNLFVVFGEPDVEIGTLDDGRLQVRIRGLDIFDPQKGEVRAGGTEDIAAWFIDTDYNEESFFVRHAYFLGAQDPYKSLKTALKAEIDEEAWSTLNSDVSRPFSRPDTGRIAVKVINHFGDEVMQVFDV